MFLLTSVLMNSHPSFTHKNNDEFQQSRFESMSQNIVSKNILFCLYAIMFILFFSWNLPNEI